MCSQQPLQLTFSIFSLLFGQLLNFVSGLLLQMSAVAAGKHRGPLSMGLLSDSLDGREKGKAHSQLDGGSGPPYFV